MTSIVAHKPKCMRRSVVYRALNSENGDFYIGVTMCGLAKRRREHLSAARKGSRGRFYNAIRKYGESSFVFEVIAQFEDYESALAAEIKCIADFQPAYNLTKGGEGASGYKHSPETIKRLADVAKGRPGYWLGKKRNDMAEFHRKRLLANPLKYWLGRTRSADTIQKISKSKKGRPRGRVREEILEIYRENMRRSARARRRPVMCLDDGRIFDCAVSAAEFYGLKPLSINQVCGNPQKRKSVFGKKFVYTASAA